MKKLTIPVALALCCSALLGIFALAAGTAPIAQNLELSTYRGVSVGGRLSATAPGGSTLTYAVTTDPVKGTVDVDEDGHFVYTPGEGKRGKDYFGYRAYDADGNASQEATVIIKIQKQKSKVTYSDLSGSGSAYAAVRLAEEGIFTGENLAGSYVFCPDAPVTRSEFLAMCMQVAGTAVPAAVRGTGFADDADIAVWAKPYVAVALNRGIIAGSTATDGSVVFSPDRAISAAEAAVMLDRTVELTDTVAVWSATDPVLPVWAQQSAANVAACGLLPYGCSLSAGQLTRGQAAELLCSTLDLLERR